MDKKRQTYALEEWKLASAIIGHLEQGIYWRQGWLYTLVTALMVALLKDNPLLCKDQFAILAIGITVLFFISEVIQRVPLHRAIKRSKTIEKSLRTDKKYQGPLLSESLAGPQKRKSKTLKGKIKSCFSSLCYYFREIYQFLRRIRVWSPYAVLAMLILLVYLIAP
jgi:hypothetical protein